METNLHGKREADTRTSGKWEKDEGVGQRGLPVLREDFANKLDSIKEIAAKLEAVSSLERKTILADRSFEEPPRKPEITRPGGPFVEEGPSESGPLSFLFRAGKLAEKPVGGSSLGVREERTGGGQKCSSSLICLRESPSPHGRGLGATRPRKPKFSASDRLLFLEERPVGLELLGRRRARKGGEKWAGGEASRGGLRHPVEQIRTVNSGSEEERTGFGGGLDLGPIVEKLAELKARGKSKRDCDELGTLKVSPPPERVVIPGGSAGSALMLSGRLKIISAESEENTVRDSVRDSSEVTRFSKLCPNFRNDSKVSSQSEAVELGQVSAVYSKTAKPVPPRPSEPAASLNISENFSGRDFNSLRVSKQIDEDVFRETNKYLLSRKASEPEPDAQSPPPLNRSSAPIALQTSKEPRNDKESETIEAVNLAVEKESIDRENDFEANEITDPKENTGAIEAEGTQKVFEESQGAQGIWEGESPDIGTGGSGVRTRKEQHRRMEGANYSMEVPIGSSEPGLSKLLSRSGGEAVASWQSRGIESSSSANLPRRVEIEETFAKKKLEFSRFVLAESSEPPGELIPTSQVPSALSARYSGSSGPQVQKLSRSWAAPREEPSQGLQIPQAPKDVKSRLDSLASDPSASDFPSADNRTAPRAPQNSGISEVDHLVHIQNPFEEARASSSLLTLNRLESAGPNEAAPGRWGGQRSSGHPLNIKLEMPETSGRDSAIFVNNDQILSPLSLDPNSHSNIPQTTLASEVLPDSLEPQIPKPPQKSSPFSQSKHNDFSPHKILHVSSEKPKSMEVSSVLKSLTGKQVLETVQETASFPEAQKLESATLKENSSFLKNFAQNFESFAPQYFSSKAVEHGTDKESSERNSLGPKDILLSNADSIKAIGDSQIIEKQNKQNKSSVFKQFHGKLEESQGPSENNETDNERKLSSATSQLKQKPSEKELNDQSHNLDEEKDQDSELGSSQIKEKISNSEGRLNSDQIEKERLFDLELSQFREKLSGTGSKVFADYMEKEKKSDLQGSHIKDKPTSNRSKIHSDRKSNHDIKVSQFREKLSMSKSKVRTEPNEKEFDSNSNASRFREKLSNNESQTLSEHVDKERQSNLQASQLRDKSLIEKDFEVEISKYSQQITITEDPINLYQLEKEKKFNLEISQLKEKLSMNRSRLSSMNSQSKDKLSKNESKIGSEKAEKDKEANNDSSLYQPKEKPDTHRSRVYSYTIDREINLLASQLTEKPSLEKSIDRPTEKESHIESFHSDEKVAKNESNAQTDEIAKKTEKIDDLSASQVKDKISNFSSLGLSKLFKIENQEVDNRGNTERGCSETRQIFEAKTENQAKDNDRSVNEERRDVDQEEDALNENSLEDAQTEEVNTKEVNHGELPSDNTKLSKIEPEEIENEDFKADEVKAEEVHTDEAKTDGVQKTDDVKIEELKTDEVKIGEVNSEKFNSDILHADQIQTEELHVDEVKTEEVNGYEVKTEEINSEEGNKDKVNTDEVHTDEVNKDELNTEEVNKDEVKTENDKTEDIKIEELITDEVKTDDLKTGEVKVENLITEEFNIEEANREEANTEKIRSNEGKSEEIKTEEAKAENIETDKLEVEEIKTEEANFEEIKNDEVETEKIKTDEVKTEIVKTEEINTNEAISEEIKSDEAETEELKTDELKTDETKNEEIENKEIKTEEFETEEIKIEEFETEEIKIEEFETEEIQTDELKTDKIENEKIETEKIKFDQVEAEELKTDEIQTENIKTDEIKTYEIKNEEIQTDEPKTEEIKTDEIKIDEIKTDEIKTEEIQTDELKTEEIKTEEIKTEELKIEEVRTDEMKNEEIQTDELKTEEIKTEEIQTHELKTEETKTEEIKTEEIQTDELKTEETKTEEIQTDEIQTDELKTEEIKTEEIKTEEIKTEEIQIDEMKNEEIQTDELKTEEIQIDEVINKDIKKYEKTTDEVNTKVIKTEELLSEKLFTEKAPIKELKAEDIIPDQFKSEETDIEKKATEEINVYDFQSRVVEDTKNKIEKIESENFETEKADNEEVIHHGEGNAYEIQTNKVHKIEGVNADEVEIDGMIKEEKRIDEVSTDEIKAKEVNNREINTDEFKTTEINLDESETNELEEDETKKEEIAIEGIQTEEVNTKESNNEEIDTERLKTEDLNTIEETNLTKENKRLQDSQTAEELQTISQIEKPENVQPSESTEVVNRADEPSESENANKVENFSQAEKSEEVEIGWATAQAEQLGEKSVSEKEEAGVEIGKQSKSDSDIMFHAVATTSDERDAKVEVKVQTDKDSIQGRIDNPDNNADQLEAEHESHKALQESGLRSSKTEDNRSELKREERNPIDLADSQKALSSK